MMRITLVITAVLAATLSAQDPYAPARYASGAVPALPAMTVEGGQTFLELTIRSNGTVESITPVRSAPPFTQVLSDAVTGWQFTPALLDAMGDDDKSSGSKTVASKVMVAGLFRAPALSASAAANQPANAGAASAEVATPSSTNEPPYPPQALAGGVVVIEATVDTNGKVAAARVISSAPPFDEPAVEAARKWRFKPARINGRATTTWVYLVFGFPAPVTGR